MEWKSDKKWRDVLVFVAILFDARDLCHFLWHRKEAERLGRCSVDTNRGDFQDDRCGAEGLDMLL